MRTKWAILKFHIKCLPLYVPFYLRARPCSEHSEYIYEKTLLSRNLTFRDLSGIGAETDWERSLHF